MTLFSCYCNHYCPHILSSRYCSIQPYLLPRLCSYGGHFFVQNHTKNPILRCLKVYSYFHVRLRHLLIDFALGDFCTFKKISPSVCIFNLTSTSGKISVIVCLQVNNFSPSWEISIITIYQVNTFSTSGEFVSTPGKSKLLPSTRHYTIFHFWGTHFYFRGNLNYYLLPGKYPFPTSGKVVSTSGEISIITFYQVNTIFHFRGTHFHFQGNLNYYLLPGKYPFLTSVEFASTSWEISISTLYQINTFFHFQGNFIFPLLGNDM